MRVNETCAELDELCVHGVVHACSVTLVVRSCSLKRTLLIEVVERDVVCAVGTTAAEIHVVVLACTSLEHFLEPVGVGIVHKLILACCGVKRVAAGKSCTGVCTSLTDIVAVLVGVHHIINIAWNLVNTEIS